MGLRYCIRPATSVDVAFLAAVMDERPRAVERRRDDVPIDRLLRTCACSAQIWAARDIEGTPTALWGVAPASDDPKSGISGCWPAKPSTTTPRNSRGCPGWCSAKC